MPNIDNEGLTQVALEGQFKPMNKPKLNLHCEICNKEIHIDDGSIIERKPLHFKCYKEQGKEEGYKVGIQQKTNAVRKEERDICLKEIDYTFANMEALLRHRFEGEDKFEEILDEIFNYKEELKKRLEKEK